MKILIGDHGHIDFDSPVEATDEQIEKVKQFFYENFNEKVVDIDKISEFRVDRLGSKLFRKEWFPPEYAELVRINKDTDELVDSLGRSAMSIEMQRIDWLEDLYRWVAQNNKKIFPDNIEEIVREYLENLKDIKLLKREERKQKNRKLKYLEKELKRLEKLLEKHKWTKRCLPSMSGIDEAIEKTIEEKKEVEDKLNVLKESLGL